MHGAFALVLLTAYVTPYGENVGLSLNFKHGIDILFNFFFYLVAGFRVCYTFLLVLDFTGEDRGTG